MLWTIIVVLIALWLIGFVACHVVFSSAFVHLLLVVALVLLIYKLIKGK